MSSQPDKPSTNDVAPRPPRRRWLGAILTALMLGMCCFVSPCAVTYNRVGLHKYQVEHCENPTRLLTVCRTLMRDCKTTAPLGDEYWEQQVQQLPVEIRELEPRYVEVHRDRVIIGFGGGFIYWWGLTALSEDKVSEAQEGREIVRGLWFYDSGDQSPH
jgi:hypothetical protein